MEKKILPWQQGQSIYAYVKEHIDESGFYAEEGLPDRTLVTTDAAVSLELGAADAYLATAENADEIMLGAGVYKEVQNYLQLPSEEHALALYLAVCHAPCILYHEILVDKLEQINITPSLKNIVLTWLEQAPHREAVKFAIVVAGLILLNSTQLREQKKIKKMLLTLALCEEFTCYVLFALGLSDKLEKEEVWNIMEHTSGWGKISAMEELDFEPGQEQEWLLANGCCLSVMYPGISLLVLKNADPLSVLKRKRIMRKMFCGILATMQSYLMVLLNYNAEVRSSEEEEELPQIPLYQTLDMLLTHAANKAKTLDDLAGLIGLSELLNAFVENRYWQQLSSNQCHLLMSKVEQLIFADRWEPCIMEQLLNEDGSLNDLAVSLATVLKLKVRPQLLKILKKNPTLTKLYFFLLQTENKKSFNNVLDIARTHLKDYAAGEEPLKPILAALSHATGQGEDFVAAGLTSIYDGTRAYALNVLEAWPQEAITPELKLALIKAKTMCQHPLLSVRIELLLQRKPADLEGFMEIISTMR